MQWLASWKNTTTEAGEGISAFHIHDVCELLYLQQGTISMEIGNTTYELHAGELAIIGRLEVHNLIPKQLPYCRIGLHVQTDALGQLGIPPFLTSLLFYHPVGWCHVFDLKDSPHIVQLIEEIHREQNDRQSRRDEMLGVLFHTLLLNLYRLAPERFHQTTGDSLMEEVRQTMEENFTDPFSVQEMADRFYMTPSHFIVRFKKYTGYTPLNYRQRCRIAYARHLLIRGNLGLEDIAEQCGFSDLNSFVRSFRQAMHISPGQFRKQARMDTNDF